MSSLLVLLLSIAPAAAPQGPAPKWEWGATPNEAYRLALADVATVPPHRRRHTRYVWALVDTPEELQGQSHTLNLVSRSTVLYQPPAVRGGRVVLLRVDAERYAPTEKDLREWLAAWEELRFDPRFSTLVTPGTAKFAALHGYPGTQRVKKTRDKLGPDGKPVLVDCPPYVHPKDGKTYSKRYEQEEYTEEQKLAPNEVLRFDPDHLDPALVAALKDATGSQAPVVSHRYFHARALATIQEAGSFKTIYGGLYYAFKGIGTKFAKGTDLDNYLERLGVGNVEQGLTFEKLFDRLKSDKRAAVFRSEVTGKPRMVIVLKSLANGDGESVVTITLDGADPDFDVDQHAVMNLQGFKPKAIEIIATSGNGLMETAIFNGDGVRQDVVPPNVASDRTVPAPYPTELQPLISCARCHVTGDGYQPLKNEVVVLLKGKLDIFDDKAVRTRDEEQRLDRLRGQYFRGSPEDKILPRARMDHAAAVLAATGPFRKTQKANADIVTLATEQMAQTYADQWYTPMGAKEALVELGVVVDYSRFDEKTPEGQKAARELAVAVLNAVVPPPLAINGLVVEEDPRIHATKQGLRPPRPDFDLVYSFMQTRAFVAHARKVVK